MSVTTTDRLPRVEELQAAVEALAAGRFRADRAPAPGEVPARMARPLETTTWATTREVLPVLAASGSSGATTLAVAVASILAPARVVECCSMSATGQTAATLL